MSEFDRCLEKRGLTRVSTGREQIARSELGTAADDLDTARSLLAGGGFKWATVTAYYAMFHAAKALVLRRGYVERTHYCLGVAFRELYAHDRETRLLADGLEAARVRREDADYRGDFDEASARDVCRLAQRLLKFASRELDQP